VAQAQPGAKTVPRMTRIGLVAKIVSGGVRWISTN
jgi:hypothetical protein